MSISNGNIETSVGFIKRVDTNLTLKDYFQNIKTRWSIGRMNYSITPGLYAIGSPDDGSDILISCNYKLSFDILRKSLKGLNVWILVIDSKGINVWCAAGKGTFGTEELINRINKHNIKSLINHKRLIVPQLGAVGISAHKVKKETGFTVIYGPVRAQDIPKFIADGYKASDDMRKVSFNFYDRIKLIPTEVVYANYYLIIVPGIFFILSGLNKNGYSVDLCFKDGARAIINLYSAYFTGCVLAPILLPLLPFRRFALKGLLAGLITVGIFFYFNILGESIMEKVSWLFLMTGISSFMTMNFTGASTFTSLSGVIKEMKTALPLQIALGSLGLILWLISRFYN